MWMVAIQKVGFCMRWSMKWEKALFCKEWTFFDKVNDDRYFQIKSMMIFKKQADVYYWHIHGVRPVQAGCRDAFWITSLTFCCPHWTYFWYGYFDPKVHLSPPLTWQCWWSKEWFPFQHLYSIFHWSGSLFDRLANNSFWALTWFYIITQFFRPITLKFLQTLPKTGILQ